MASNPKAAGKPNEDFVGTTESVVVLLDGAGIPGTESICSHGVVWYVHQLGGALLRRLSNQADEPLHTALADCIDEVTDSHRRSCDTANPSSPQATVALLRTGDESAEYLLLADSYLVLDPRDSDPQVLTDKRELDARRTCAKIGDKAEIDSADKEVGRQAYLEAMWAQRNHPGGYWIAKDDPRAALEAVTGAVPISELRGAGLLSNGASRYVDPYGLGDWPQAVELLRDGGGPGRLIHDLRAAETSSSLHAPAERAKPADDATVAYRSFL